MTDTAPPVTLTRFGGAHLSEAVTLSEAERWPHRPADWQLIHDLSEGRAAEEDGQLVGTAFCTPYGEDVACLNMIIVGAPMRGRGLGRRLMDEIMALAGPRSMRLVATQSGLPLYRKMGFREVGRIVQQQGIAKGIHAPVGVDMAGPEDFGSVLALDRAAFGADREALIRKLGEIAEIAVLRGPDGLEGAAWCRDFGRGKVIGPVIAGNAEVAQRLIAVHVARNPGTFLRIDSPAGSGLQDWLEQCGLAHSGGGVVMEYGQPRAHPETGPRTFALASQALG